MAKKVKAVITLQLPAGKATPAPPVGPALGQHGINMMAFLKEYNERTATQAGSVIPALITIFEDRSFSFVTKTPPAADLIKKARRYRKGQRQSRTATTSGDDLRARVARNRRDQNEGFERQRHRCRHAHDRRRGAQHGRRGSGLIAMAKHGKKYRAAAEAGRPAQAVRDPTRGVKLVKDASFAKFDESVELHIRTGLDPRHADQIVRGSAVLPAGTGRRQRVVAFAQGDKAREAEAAGADVVGADDLVQRIQAAGPTSTSPSPRPDMMGAVGRLGKMLGPRGLMPNPARAPSRFDIGGAIREIKGGPRRVQGRSRGHRARRRSGSVSFTPEQLSANMAALVDAVKRAKPSRRQGHLHAHA